MQRPDLSMFRMPRWLLWSLAPVATAALLSTGTDLVQAGGGVSPMARQQQASADVQRADAVSAEPARQQR